MSPEEGPKKEFFKKFFIHATTKKIRCIDERIAPDQNNGVQIQGATSGLVDAYKSVMGVSEDAAWKALSDAGIPIDGHVDEHHGCGYNLQVESNPAAVDAPGSASVSDRVSRVAAAHGNLLHYKGDHNPKYATINYMKDKTLNTNDIFKSQTGTFNLDVWAIDGYAKMLHLDHDKADLFKSHIIRAYMDTVTTLTHGAIASFIEIR